MDDEVRVAYPLPRELKQQLTDIAVLLEVSEKVLVTRILRSRVTTMIEDSPSLEAALKAMKDMREHRSTGDVAPGE